MQVRTYIAIDILDRDICIYIIQIYIYTLSLCPSVLLFINLQIYLSSYLFIYPSVHLSIDCVPPCNLQTHSLQWRHVQLAFAQPPALFPLDRFATSHFALAFTQAHTAYNTLSREHQPAVAYTAALTRDIWMHVARWLPLESVVKMQLLNRQCFFSLSLPLSSFPRVNKRLHMVCSCSNCHSFLWRQYDVVTSLLLVCRVPLLPSRHP
jgi:hypothetical protein